MPRRSLLIFGAALVFYLLSTGSKTQPTTTTRCSPSLAPRPRLDRRAPRGDRRPAIPGHFYIIEAPMPAVLMLPLVLIFGEHANQTIVGVVCAAVAVAAADVLLGRMALAAATRVADRFFAAGTVLWWCTAFGAVWMFAHVAGAMFALLALAEWFGQRRPWLVGLLHRVRGAVALSTVLAALPFRVMAMVRRAQDQRLRTARCALPPACFPCSLLYALYNDARWQTPGDIGYTLWYHQDRSASRPEGRSSCTTCPSTCTASSCWRRSSMADFPWLKPTGLGVALTLTSPALFLAFWRRCAGARRSSGGARPCSSAAPSLLYYVNGFEQFGMRHASISPPSCCRSSRAWLAARTGARCEHTD